MNRYSNLKEVRDSSGVRVYAECPACGSKHVYANSHFPSEGTRVLRVNRCLDCQWENPELRK